MSTAILDECVNEVNYGDGVATDETTLALLNCITHSLQSGLDTFFLLYSASLVFLMQAGFAMVCAGCVQKKNVQNSMLKNLLDACGAAVGFYCFGYAFAFGGSTANGSPTTFIGNTNFFLMGLDENFLYQDTTQGNSFWLFQFAFAATAATIVAGTLAERCQMSAYLGYSFLLTSFIYPVAVHAVWSPNGFLSPLNANPLFGVGMIDFSGSGVVHTTGGITALIATKILGARRGRFHDLRGNQLAVPKKFMGHSASLQVLGTFLLWFGWYGFNPGSVLFVSLPAMAQASARAAVTTTLAAAAGSVAALGTNLIVTERLYGEAVYDLGYALNGALGGLVAITAGCTVVETWASLVIGGIGGLLFLGCSMGLEKLCLDDAVDAIPVHFANGVWGCIAVGFFATPTYLGEVYGSGASENAGWFYEWARGSANGRLLAAQIVGLLFIMAWAAAFMYPFFSFIDFMGWFRADSLEELVGLDISYHGGNSPEGTSNTEFVEAMKVKKSMDKKGFFRRRKTTELQDMEVDMYGHDSSNDIVNGNGNGNGIVNDNVIANASGSGHDHGHGNGHGNGPAIGRVVQVQMRSQSQTQVTEQYHPQPSNYDEDDDA